ncbi:MAG: hypothetical protein V9G15_14870 [Dermatophilaceae bacterium]
MALVLGVRPKMRSKPRSTINCPRVRVCPPRPGTAAPPPPPLPRPPPLRKATVIAVGGWVALLGIVAGDHSGEGGFGEAVEGGIRADCFGQRCQERQPRHPVWCRSHGHPTGGHRTFHPRHDCGSVDLRGDPPRRSREGPVAQRRQVRGEAFIHHAALLTGQAGGLTHDQGGPVFTDHPTGEGGHGVGHLHMQSVREPDMLITPGR